MKAPDDKLDMTIAHLNMEADAELAREDPEPIVASPRNIIIKLSGEERSVALALARREGNRLRDLIAGLNAKRDTVLGLMNGLVDYTEATK